MIHIASKPEQLQEITKIGVQNVRHRLKSLSIHTLLFELVDFLAFPKV